MGEAIIFSVLVLLAALGTQKLFELIKKVTLKEGKGKAYLVYKMEKDCKNTEMIVRSLVADAEEIITTGGCTLLIVDDETDEETKKICIDTAQQYQNTLVIKSDGILDIIK